MIPILDQIEDLTIKHKMNDRQIAKLLGVPLTTLRGWTYGVRVAGASVYRTLELLELMELHAPALYKEMIEQAKF